MTDALGVLSIDRSDADDRTLRVVLTPAHVVVVVLALQALVLLGLALPRLGHQVPLVRATAAVLYLAVVPGFLVLKLLGVDPASRVESALYTVGLSLTVLMALGTAANFGLRAVGIARPFTELPLVLAVSGAVLVLTGLYYWRGTDPVSVAVPIRDLTSPWTLGLTLLPFLGVYGALALAINTDNRLLLVLYGLVALIPVAVAAGALPRRLHPYALWMLSLALLLQNTLSNPYLAWGDQPKEADLVVTVLREGVWTPGTAPAFGNKYAMLRIVVLHPLYELFAGIDVVWLFKLVHPLLFSITPVVLYAAYRKQTDADVAFYGSFLYVSLFSFFVVLSRNTRTSTAVLFLAFLALLIGDDAIGAARAKLLAILFVSSIVVSHYGVSYMVMAAIVAVIPVRLALQYASSLRGSGVRSSPTRPRRAMTSVAFVLFYSVVTFSWYIYASPDAKTFSLLVGFGDRFVQTLLSEFIVDPDATSATVRVITSDWNSTTIQALKVYNVAIGLLIGLGLLAAAIRFVSDRHGRSFDVEYLAYAGVFLALFGFTFLPVERFNTARTFPTTLVFFAPFLVLGVRVAFRGLSRRVRERAPDDRSVRRLAAVCSVGLLVGYFLLNVGFVSAAVTHEFSPNALVEKDRIMDDGHPVEQEYFYKQHPTVYEGASTEWLRTRATPNASVASSQWPGNPDIPFGYERTTTRPFVPLENTPIEAGQRVDDSYVYLGSLSYVGNTVSLPAGGHFGFRWARTDEVDSQWAHKSRVYDNGGSAVYG